MRGGVWPPPYSFAGLGTLAMPSVTFSFERVSLLLSSVPSKRMREKIERTDGKGKVKGESERKVRGNVG